jgi:hypothetical protein
MPTLTPELLMGVAQRSPKKRSKRSEVSALPEHTRGFPKQLIQLTKQPIKLTKQLIKLTLIKLTKQLIKLTKQLLSADGRFRLMVLLASLATTPSQTLATTA